MLLGDPADNIPGLKGYGSVKVYETYKDEMRKVEPSWSSRVEEEYRKVLGDDYQDRFEEIFFLLKIGGHNGK